MQGVANLKPTKALHKKSLSIPQKKITGYVRVMRNKGLDPFGLNF